MAPTIKPGERVTVDYSAYALRRPQRWDVVAFQPPMFTNQVWLMRIIGLTGETVAITNSTLIVNGAPLVLPSRISNVTYIARGQFGVASPLGYQTNVISF
jgi:signal peptidase I